MELNVVKQLSRRGYRFSGRATVHTQGTVFEEAIAMVVAEKNVDCSVAAVVLLEVAHAAPLVSPGYWHISDENSMRTAWLERRWALDNEFEAHLAAEGPFRIVK